MIHCLTSAAVTLTTTGSAVIHRLFATYGRTRSQKWVKLPSPSQCRTHLGRGLETYWVRSHQTILPLFDPSDESVTGGSTRNCLRSPSNVSTVWRYVPKKRPAGRGSLTCRLVPSRRSARPGDG